MHTWDDRGLLNAPWGVAFAPQGFGEYSGKLLVGNFGDGTIVAFDSTTHAAIDYVRDADGKPISIEGLWGLQFGNGVSLGMADAMYFAAGPHDETEGLFGRIQAAPIPEPETWALYVAGLALLGLAVVYTLERVAAKTGREQRTDFSAAEVVFHVELDRVNLIEDSFLESSVFEHLAVSRSLFLVDNSLD